MALAATLLAVALLAVLVYWVRNRRLLQLAAKFPKPTLWLPVIGNLADTIYHYSLSDLKWCHGYYERLGPVSALWVSSELHVFTALPEDVEAVVTSPALINKAINYDLLWPWLGDGLLLQGGKKWHLRRKQLTPTFHFRILEQFMEVLNEKGAVLEDVMNGLVGQGVVDVRPAISRHALDVICETAMGTKLNCQLQQDQKYVNAVKVACGAIDKRFSRPWLKHDGLFRLTAVGKDFYGALDVLHGVTNKVIRDRKAELVSEMKQGAPAAVDDDDDGVGTKKRMMFIDQLLTMHLQGEDLSEKDIFDEVNTFMFEGHDTTMTSVCFTLFLLATHPDVQERAAEEARGLDDISTTAQLSELKYLEAVIKESLRLYPSVPLFSRSVKEEFKLPSGYILPVGSTIIINAYLMHRIEENFKDPAKFDPERFMAGRGENGARHPFSYVPFSAGFRNCIGQRFAMMSMKATLARLLRRFRFAPASADAQLDLDVQVVLISKSGIPLAVERR